MVLFETLTSYEVPRSVSIVMSMILPLDGARPPPISDCLQVVVTGRSESPSDSEEGKSETFWSEDLKKIAQLENVFVGSDN